MGAWRGDDLDPQLQFYELLYYGDQVGKEGDAITNPYLYFIEYKKLEPISKRIDIEDSIVRKLKEVLEVGYRINEKRHDYENNSITRRDLYNKRKIK